MEHEDLQPYASPPRVMCLHLQKNVCVEPKICPSSTEDW